MISLAAGQNYSVAGIDKNETIPKGLQVGALAPGFNGTNQFGDTVNLKEKLKTGKVVLIFYRGYWCPVCNRYLQNYQDSLQLIIDKGAHFMAITPEQAEGVRKTIGKTGASFDLITDSSNHIMQLYGVDFKVTGTYQFLVNVFESANIAKNNGQEEAYLPVPATYIIGTDGRIEYVQFDPNYKIRASVKQILENL
ncbi:MAG: AhpC/TSA family protein [Bacteroidales bacterium]|nr:AhpC/TSA family protein [Bacteroidales bacterium]